MNRRAFIAAIAAALLAGPKALAALLEQHRRSAMVFSIDFPHQFVWRNRTTLQGAYRKMQGKLLEGFQWQAEEWDAYVRVADAPSGFRAWSQRYPS